MKAKIILGLALVLILAGAGTFGLMKFGILPAKKWAGLHTPLGMAVRLIGFKPLTSAKKAPPVQPGAAAALTPQQQQEQQQLQQEQQQLQQDRAAFQQQQAAQQKPAAPVAAAAVPPDPAQIARLAEIYSSMDPASAYKILSRLPDSEMILLLQQMSEKKVAAILALMPPAKAALTTSALANQHPAGSTSPPSGAGP